MLKKIIGTLSAAYLLSACIASIPSVPEPSQSPTTIQATNTCREQYRSEINDYNNPAIYKSNAEVERLRYNIHRCIKDATKLAEKENWDAMANAEYLSREAEMRPIREAQAKAAAEKEAERRRMIEVNRIAKQKERDEDHARRIENDRLLAEMKAKEAAEKENKQLNVKGLFTFSGTTCFSSPRSPMEWSQLTTAVTGAKSRTYVSMAGLPISQYDDPKTGTQKTLFFFQSYTKCESFRRNTR